MKAMASLLIKSGQHKGKKLTIAAGKEIRIGRDRSCQLRLNSTDVSKIHCILSATENGLFIEDAGSRNGTLVNTAPIGKRTRLKSGDQLTIGPFSFEVLGEQPPTNDETILDWLSDDEADSGTTTIIETTADLSITRIEGVIIVRVATQQISAYNINQIVEKLSALVDPNQDTKIVLDLGSVESIFSTGLVRLAEFEGKLREAGGKLRLCNLQSVIRETFEVTQMHKKFKILADEELARKSFP